jgi:hypothetical protein
MLEEFAGLRGDFLTVAEVTRIVVGGWTAIGG